MLCSIYLHLYQGVPTSVCIIIVHGDNQKCKLGNFTLQTKQCKNSMFTIFACRSESCPLYMTLVTLFCVWNVQLVKSNIDENISMNNTLLIAFADISHITTHTLSLISDRLICHAHVQVLNYQSLLDRCQ